MLPIRPFAWLALSLVCSIGIADFPELFNTEPLAESTRMDAEKAAASMSLPEGFRASVFASEPDVQNPIAMAFDLKGRLWIAENYTYAERSQRFQLDLRDRIVIFDNTDGDRFKKRTVFTDNVQMLTGLEVDHDGVWLMCPPKLIFIPDRNHDDIPDNPGEVVLDGFTVAQQNFHNFANGLRFGPDGWLYGRCGGSCPGRIGQPGTPDEHRLALEGGIWRYHPKRKTVEVLTAGTTNPWGHDWNDHGEMFFVNTVNGHLWHLIPGAHFTRPFTLDPNRRTYQLIDFHADHWHFDTGASWTKSRDGAANSYGGGHAHSGTLIYRENQWPKKYRGNLFTLNFHGRRANQETLHRRGSGYVASHAKDFCLSKDTWFRGMEMMAGPDGGVFVLDWSDTGECHEHTGVHRTSGRIFKISYPGADNRNPSEHETRAYHLRTDRKALLARAANGDSLESEIAKLVNIISTPSNKSSVRVQSLLTLFTLDAATPSFLSDQLADKDEHVRAWAIRMLTDTWQLDDPMGPVFVSNEEAERIEREATRLLPRLVAIAEKDSSALVRLTLASTLQRLPVSLRSQLAASLVKHGEDADDHNLPLMIWYGLIAVADHDATQLVTVAENCQLPTTLRLISRCLAEEIEKQPKAVSALLAVSEKRNDELYQREVLAGLSLGLKGWRRAPKPSNWDAFTARLTSRKHQPLIQELSAVFGDGRALDELKRIVKDTKGAAPETRIAALETLIQSEPDDLRAFCESLMTDQKVNVIAARGLSKFDDPKIGELLVKRYRNVRGNFRPQIISILASRKSFASSLLDAVGDGQIPRSDLTAFHVRQIHSLDDEAVSKKVGKVWGELRESSAEKKEAIETLKRRLDSTTLAKADKSNGRKLFVKNCQNCHRLYGEGQQIGPDLTGSDRGNMDYLLGNIVDPSAVVDKDFRMTILLLDDDRVVNGLVVDESDRTLTLQTATEKLTIDRDTVVGRKVTDKSPMPDGILGVLSDNEIRDLIGYLRHPSQVPLP